MSKLSLVTTPRSAQYKYGNSLRGHRLNLNQSEPVKGFFRVIRNVHKFREEGSWGQKLRGGEGEIYMHFRIDSPNNAGPGEQ